MVRRTSTGDRLTRLVPFQEFLVILIPIPVGWSEIHQTIIPLATFRRHRYPSC